MTIKNYYHSSIPPYFYYEKKSRKKIRHLYTKSISSIIPLFLVNINFLIFSWKYYAKKFVKKYSNHSVCHDSTAPFQKTNIL